MQNTKHFSQMRISTYYLAGIGLAFLLTLACLLAPVISPYDPAKIDLSIGLQFPSSQHLLGTDQMGRDIFSRLLYAGRISILISTIVVGITVILGMLIGLFAGYFEGLLGNLLMRLADFIWSIPQLIFVLALIGIYGPGLHVLVFSLALSGWVRYARLGRSIVFTQKIEEYIFAARAIGATDGRIMFRHLLPFLIGPLIVQSSLDVGANILVISGLSFLGLGVQPPTPEWGAMLVEARPFMDYAPHLVLSPGLAILVMVFGWNSLAEWVEKRISPESAS